MPQMLTRLPTVRLDYRTGHSAKNALLAAMPDDLVDSLDLF
jgi:hypothetical protein